MVLLTHGYISGHKSQSSSLDPIKSLYLSFLLPTSHLFLCVLSSPAQAWLWGVCFHVCLCAHHLDLSVFSEFPPLFSLKSFCVLPPVPHLMSLNPQFLGRSLETYPQALSPSFKGIRHNLHNRERGGSGFTS